MCWVAVALADSVMLELALEGEFDARHEFVGSCAHGDVEVASGVGKTPHEGSRLDRGMWNESLWHGQAGDALVDQGCN